MQRESDSESEDGGILLVPVAVSKSRTVDYQLRKEITFLSKLRKEYEVNMLEVKKELLDEKIHKKKVEEQSKEFLEAVIKGRQQWYQENRFLEKELTKTREEVAQLRSQLKLQKDMSSRARSPSMMPKEERVAAVDAIMEVVGVRNELAASARCMKALINENKELKKKINDLAEENTDMKNEIERLQSQVFSEVLENEKGREVNEKQKDEELRSKYKEVTLRTDNRRKERGLSEDAMEKKKTREKERGEGRDKTSKRHRRDVKRADATPRKRRKYMKELTAVEKAVAIPRKRRKDSEKLAALEEARIKVGQARDPREISNILGRLNVKKVTVAKGSPTGLWIASNKVGIL